MDVTTTLNTAKTVPTNQSDIASNPKAILKKDDFLKLLLTELQYQDPTDPMDSEKILSQTSELATLEAADNTNKTLNNLAKTMEETSGMSIVSAIGKMGSLGKDTVLLNTENKPQFDLYFGDDVADGTITIKDINGNTIQQIPIRDLPAGIHTYSWDGTDDSGVRVEPGSYTIEAQYVTPNGERKSAAYGRYPIESVRFDKGKAEVKMGSHYYPVDQLKEIYEG